MKRAILRPQARADVKTEVRCYRENAGQPTVSKLAQSIEDALQRLQRQPGVGSPRIGYLLDIPGLKCWRLTRFPLFWLYFERDDFLDVVRLLGDRQDILFVLGDSLTDKK